MPKYKSRICEAVHETASDMHCGGCITDAEMREFDALCLEPVPSYDADTIRKLRKRLDVSQVMLASVLNTSVSTVQKWDVGAKKPGGPSNKLLFLLDRKGLDALLP